MRKITKLTMKDVRCFKGEQSINIRPITLLVGENSGGKSTVLGCYHALLYFFTTQLLDFNVAPFEMGSFADIRRKGNDTSPELLNFSVSYETDSFSNTMRKVRDANTEFMISIDDNFGKESINYQFTFGEHAGEIVIRKLTIKFLSGGSITIAYNANKVKKSIKFLTEKTQDDFLIEYGQYRDMENSNIIDHIFIDLLGMLPFMQQLEAEEEKKSVPFFEKFIKNKMSLITGKKKLSLLDVRRKLLSPAENFAGISPIRSKPQRTYNPFSGQTHSEGDEVPLFMRRLMRTNQEAWGYLRQELVNFGNSSGMFKDISIRTFNDNMNDPFQIHVKHGEHYVNIMDVGYGVSQILPILVKIIMDKYNRENRNSQTSKSFNPNLSTRFLLQQPEMHLHPQAQAAFGSLLVHFAENGKGQNFLVETHSDYIVDRICTEIRDGIILPENVSLVYHEMKKGYVQLHNITFDKMGNLENVPDGYRDFFMHEMNKVLGF